MTNTASTTLCEIQAANQSTFINDKNRQQTHIYRTKYVNSEGHLKKKKTGATLI
jgi:hypothetical protein